MQLLAYAVGGGAVLTIAVLLVFPGAGVLDAAVVAIFVPLQLVATRVGVRLWRGTVPHTVITSVPPSIGLSLRRYQAIAPCGIIAMDGLVLAFLMVVLFGADGSAAEPIGMAGGLVFVIFGALMAVVAVTLRPRILLPGTMRREISK